MHLDVMHELTLVHTKTDWWPEMQHNPVRRLPSVCPQHTLRLLALKLDGYHACPPLSVKVPIPYCGET